MSVDVPLDAGTLKIVPGKASFVVEKESLNGRVRRVCGSARSRFLLGVSSSLRISCIRAADSQRRTKFTPRPCTKRAAHKAHGINQGSLPPPPISSSPSVSFSLFSLFFVPPPPSSSRFSIHCRGRSSATSRSSGSRCSTVITTGRRTDPTRTPWFINYAVPPLVTELLILSSAVLLRSTLYR